MKKNYQSTTAAAPINELVMPEVVTLTMAEVTGAVKEGLLALAVGAGLQVMQILMEEDVTGLAGRRGRHDPDRVAKRHGSEDGSVTLGGRRVPVRRPRVRSADGRREMTVPAYEAFTSTEILDQLALERMMAKLSTRRYRAGLEPVGAAVTSRWPTPSPRRVADRRGPVPPRWPWPCTCAPSWGPPPAKAHLADAPAGVPVPEDLHYVNHPDRSPRHSPSSSLTRGMLNGCGTGARDPSTREVRDG